MHPYRTMGTREANAEKVPNIDRAIGVVTTMVGFWALLRIVVAVVQHRLSVEAAIAALVAVVLATGYVRRHRYRGLS